MKKVAVIGSGFSSLSCACYLAKSGYDVSVFEKNLDLGGRARSFKTQGFTFDMGPSWYWMPDVFDKFFSDFDCHSSDFYELVRLDPSYKVFFDNEYIDIPAGAEAVGDLFESIEPGSKIKLLKFLKEAKYKYETGMNEYVRKPSLSVFEFLDWKVLSSFWKMDMFSSIQKQIFKNFKSDKIRQILQFPVLFLGATPAETPAMYSLMNYADIALGTWYPMGGMSKVTDAFITIANRYRVQFHTASPVEKISETKDLKKITLKGGQEHLFDYVVSGADYHHTEQKLLSKEHQSYDKEYWDSRVLAPSSLLYYVGLDKKLPGIKHHNLFFDKDFDTHAKEIYQEPSWPTNPLFYICCPSKTDDSVAPQNNENLFILIPLAPGLEDKEEIRERYFDIIVERLKNLIGIDITNDIIFKKSFCVSDFETEYNSFKGNAYGLANTLMQTAFLKPQLKSKKMQNLYFTGQLTSPGPGVPPSIISGEVVANLIIKKNSL